jgi:hypothetical protein
MVATPESERWQGKKVNTDGAGWFRCLPPPEIEPKMAVLTPSPSFSWNAFFSGNLIPSRRYCPAALMLYPVQGVTAFMGASSNPQNAVMESMHENFGEVRGYIRGTKTIKTMNTNA